MINKKEFDLLLQEIFQIENKIEEVKILKEFDKAREYEIALEEIRLQAKDIVLDSENNSNGFDDISLEVLSKLISLDASIDYFVLKLNNIIESANENRIDVEALQKIKNLWNSLEKDIKIWNESNHNPIEEIEYNKHIGKMTLDIIVFQLEAEGILDFLKVFKYCKKEYLLNAIKETLFEGAKEEFHDEIRRNRMVDLAKNLSEKDLYDYKIWKQVLMIKNVKSRDDHIEIIGNFQDKEQNKYDIKKDIYGEKEKNTIISEDMELYYDESIIKSLKRWFVNINELAKQKKMNNTWATIKGPAFMSEFEDGNVKYSTEFLDKNVVENVKKLTVATNGVAKYNFERNAEWKNLEEIEFLKKSNTSNNNLSPDKTYNCIGNDAFVNCNNLKNIIFGKIQIIGERAFKNCTSLTTVIFPEEMMNIGEDAFADCTSLKKAIFQGNLKLYILDRPHSVINCFKGSGIEQIVFANIESAFNFAITDCPHLKHILISNVSNLSIPFETCKYRLGRQEGIVSFVGEKSLNLWKKKNSNIRFFELTDEDRKKYGLIN